MLDNPLVGLYVIPRNVDYGYYRDNYELFNAERHTVPTQNWIVEDYTSLEVHSQLFIEGFKSLPSAKVMAHKCIGRHHSAGRGVSIREVTL